MNYGVIGYYVPHRVYPAGHHCDPKQPLPFAGLGSQRHHMSLYLMCLHGESGASDSAAKHVHRFREAWAQTEQRPDMGKACIRFKKVEDLALDVIGEAIRRVPAKAYIEYCEASLRKAKERPPARKKSARAPKSAASSGR